ncbi:hypothetical protein [Planktothrix sp.]|uniref:hypothetical protein n=1 Tax=Planktothrix sp. TaxID=3088171 RepID=UPI0038D3F132
MSIETESTPTKAQMQAAIAQTLSKPFAYNAPVVVLDFSVNDQGEFEGKFKDAARPRVFSFNIEGQSVTFKPYAPGRMDSAEDWEEFSSGYSYRADAGIGGNKKPQCVKPTAYNCGAACINIMKSCKTKTDDPTIKDRLKNLNEIGKDYAETVKTTKTPKISEPAKTAKVDPKTEAEKPTEKPTEKPVEKPVEKQTQEKTKPLSIAQKNAQTIENLAKKAGVDVSKLVETARKAGATEAQLLTLKNGVANYMKAKGIVPGSELKTTRSEEEGLTGDGSHEGMPRNAQEYYNLATKNGKQITLKEAQDTVDAIKDWAGAGYEEIRKDQKEGRVNERATLIDNYIKNLTPYKGEVYRGITFDNKKEMDAWLKGDKDGILGNQNAHASWSSELYVAKDFASVEDDLGRVSVVIKSVNNKSGVSISNLSSYGKTESEVIVSKDAKHKVKSVREEGGVVYVEVEEVDSPPEKSSTKQEEVKTQQKTPEQKVGKLTPSLVSKEDQIKTAKEWYATAKQFKIKGKKVLDALSEDDMIGGKKVNREALENTLDLVFDSSIVIDGLIYSAQEKPGKQDTIFLKDESGNAQGFFMVGNEKSKDSMYIEYLGTNPLNIIQSKKGVGKQIMYQAIQESIKRGLKGRIKLEALDTSESFYEAVGFQRKTEKVFEDSKYYDTDYFELSEESAKAFVEKYEKTLK